MKDVESAKRLAEAMVAIGKASGRETVATLTDMEQPLGFAIGNTLEVIEAIETLKGRGPKDFAELCYNLSAEVFLISGIASTMEEAWPWWMKSFLPAKRWKSLDRWLNVRVEILK